MSTILIIIIIILILNFREKVSIQKNNHEGLIDKITYRFIFLIKIESYRDMIEIANKKHPLQIKEYIGLQGKLYKKDYIRRRFFNKSSPNFSKHLKPYNKNLEYEKVTYKNNLYIEIKKGTNKGIKIEKFEYDTHGRRTRHYIIFDSKEKEREHFEYDDKNRIITQKSFSYSSGELDKTTIIELTKSDSLIKDNDRISSFSRDWVKKTSSSKSSKTITYYTRVEGELYSSKMKKREFYIQGELYSEKEYDPITDEKISETIHEKSLN